MALFDAYFTAGENLGSHDVLVRLAGQVGLDPAEAARILASDTYAAEVREREQFFQRQGINSVPAIIINQKPPDLGRPAAGSVRAGAAPDIAARRSCPPGS